MPKLKARLFLMRLDHLKSFSKIAAEQGLSTTAFLRSLMAKEIRRAKKEAGRQ